MRNCMPLTGSKFWLGYNEKIGPDRFQYGIDVDVPFGLVILEATQQYAIAVAEPLTARNIENRPGAIGAIIGQMTTARRDGYVEIRVLDHMQKDEWGLQLLIADIHRAILEARPEFRAAAYPGLAKRLEDQRSAICEAESAMEVLEALIVEGLR